jgi:propionyl-CoA carboxylase alpha chain
MPKRTMHTLLVANRGEIASRVFRTARALGIRTVAVHSDPDAGLPFVRDADIAVRLPGAAPADTYLRIDLIIDAARRSGADAVHPGYGFLAENAAFAQAVIDAGLLWVGPPPNAIAAMGSKIAAKETMRSTGVPVLPEATIAADQDAAAILAAGTTVGYPLLVKASAGGGGRGMRVVHEPESLVAAVDAATREATAAFGDGTVFLERYVVGGRHVEIQVFADEHGQYTALHERECSVQRRHQKIVEECPSPAVDAELRRAMGDAAVAAARAVDYVGAGTVEFLLESGTDGAPRFWFLEMNTRLQVEHPVTELVTGLDLVALQIAVAEGRALPRTAIEPALSGHAVEVRLCAEEPVNGYRPAVGHIDKFEVPRLDGVRVDTGYGTGSVVSPHYDSMLAKVIAHGTDRDAAVRLLRRTLEQTVVAGVSTNREQLVEILEHEAFVEGRLSTGFIDDHSTFGGAHRTDALAPALVAAALGLRARRRATAPVLGGMPPGWRNNPSVPQRAEFRVSTDGRERVHRVDYLFDRAGNATMVRLDDEDIPVVPVSSTDETVVLEQRGVRSTWRITAPDVPDELTTERRVHVTGPDTSFDFVVLPRFTTPGSRAQPGSLVAPMPGAIVRIGVAVGDAVAEGDVLVTIEAMKMEHGVRAPSAGVVSEVLVAPGQQVDAGLALLVLGDAPGSPA